MPAPFTAAEFEQRVNQLSERLDALRGTARPTLGSALPYAGLDLTPVLPDLAPVLNALLHEDADEPITTNPRIQVGGRRLALAALMTLVRGGEGLGDFAERYQQAVGEEPDFAQLERLLPAAMREAGLAIPAKPDGKKLLAALLVASGLPSALVMAVARYFVHYWRWFSPQPSPMAPLQALAKAERDWCGLAPDLRGELDELASKLLPNAPVVAPVLEGLTTLMLFLRTQGKLRATDLFSHADEIKAGSAIDPRELLQNHAEAAEHLGAALSQAYHPDQFRHLMTALPRGGEVRQPSGALALVERAVAVPQWGVYRLEGKSYLVLPNEALSLEAVKAMPKETLCVVGNRAIYRGETDGEVTADEWPQLRKPLPLFEERQALGFFYFQAPPQARALTLAGHTLAPRPGVSWRLALHAAVDDAGAPTLSARVLGLRVCLPELAGKTLQLECPQAETAGRLTFELDERGVGGLPDLVLAIAAPSAGAFEVFLQDHTSGEVVELDGQPVVNRLPMPEIMLFAEATGQPVPPSPNVYPYGLPSYLIMGTRPINTGALEMIDVGTQALGAIGDYTVHRLSWKDADQSFNVVLDAHFAWHFSYRVESVWQAGELPPAPAPMAFAPETPVGYTVATADHLLVDDVSLVADPLVTLSRDGELLAAHTWRELNWMMNFPEDNRRFSGVMLRRALHADSDFDLAGRYNLALRAGGELLGERLITILPELAIAIAPTGTQSEETSYTLRAKAALPSFANGARAVSVELGSPVVDREVMENSPFLPKPLETTLHLQVPQFDLPISYHADIAGFRLLDDNEGTWVRKTNLSYEELSHLTLVLFAAHGQVGTLSVDGEERLSEEFYEGFATFSLADLQESLLHHETTLRVAVDGKPYGELTVHWHPQVAHFEASHDYLVDLIAQLEVQIAGPDDVPVRLEAFSPDGRKLANMELRAEGGALQQIAFPVLPARDYPVVTIRAFVPTEVSGTPSGSLEVRNASFEPEIEEINRRIAAEPNSADLRYERAQLLLARGLRKAAARDFQSAIDLGMTSLLESPQYQQFMSQRHAESFHEDIKALASFFVPFARKELNIG